MDIQKGELQRNWVATCTYASMLGAVKHEKPQENKIDAKTEEENKNPNRIKAPLPAHMGTKVDITG